MSANNKAALVRSVMPAISMLILSIVLLFARPTFMTSQEAIASLALNIIAFISTVKWQRKLQSDMAYTGFDDSKIKLLLSTNWIRTIAFMLPGILTIAILVSQVK